MNEQYGELYGILIEVDKLSEEQYNQLISLYGDNVVNSSIEYLVKQNEENFYKF